MPKIIVAGGGHGGIVAAINLAKNGFDVTIFEALEQENVGLAQTDALDMNAFSFAGLEVPEYFKRGRNKITFLPKDTNTAKITLPTQGAISLLVDRKELITYLFAQAEKAGVKIVYGERVLSPLLLGNRIAGIVTDKGQYYADLVIDACGVESPVRSGLPAYLGVNRPIDKYDVVYSYRGYFNRIQGEIPPETDYNIYFKDDGNVGFYWAVTEFDRIDVLVCRFYKPDDNEILTTLNTIHEENAHMGLDLVYGGIHDVIPVCQPLALLVADGYAAVGDSAFMTIALKGSGLAYSIKAGKLLADAVIADENCCYNQEALWEYQRAFFKEIGIGAGGMAVLKNLLPYLSSDDVNKIFALKLITTEELSDLWANKGDAIFNAKGIASLKSKIRKINDEPMLKALLGNLVVWLTKYAVLQASFPNKYDKKELVEWVEKYNKFFSSIKKKD